MAKAKSKVSENCPFSGECERKCIYVSISKCDYYQANRRPGFGMPHERSFEETLAYNPKKKK